MRFVLSVLFVMASCGIARAETFAPATRPTTAPTTLPAARQAEIDQLITKLGHDDPKVRQDASEALRKIGKDALPSLAKARSADDLEVSTRAEAITRQIEDDQKPKVAETEPGFFGKRPGMWRGQGNVQVRIGGGMNGNIIVNGGNGVMHVAIARTERNGVKDVSVTENDRTVKIHEDKEGISVTVTEPDKEGKQQTKEYKAKDAETLKKEHPEAHAIYEKYSGQGGPIQIQGLQIQGLNIQGGGAAMDPKMQQMIEDAHKRAEEARQRAEQMRQDALKRMEETRKRAEQQE